MTTPATATFSCPHCKKTTSLSNNPFRPFCSERCQLIDFGGWANEDYKIAQQNPTSDFDDILNYIELTHSPQQI